MCVEAAAEQLVREGHGVAHKLLWVFFLVWAYFTRRVTPCTRRARRYTCMAAESRGHEQNFPSGLRPPQQEPPLDSKRASPQLLCRGGGHQREKGPTSNLPALQGYCRSRTLWLHGANEGCLALAHRSRSGCVSPIQQARRLSRRLVAQATDAECAEIRELKKGLLAYDARRRELGMSDIRLRRTQVSVRGFTLDGCRPSTQRVKILDAFFFPTVLYLCVLRVFVHAVSRRRLTGPFGRRCGGGRRQDSRRKRRVVVCAEILKPIPAECQRR